MLCPLRYTKSAKYYCSGPASKAMVQLNSSYRQEQRKYRYFWEPELSAPRKIHVTKTLELVTSWRILYISRVKGERRETVRKIEGGGRRGKYKRE
jgi:hypothetical protein